MRISQDKEKYLEYYLQSIHFAGELQLNSVRQMVEFKGQGAEYFSCSFDPDDEDYKDGFVTLLFWQPADDEDTMVYVENSFFYEAIERVSKEHIRKNSKDEKELNSYLLKIRDMLSVNHKRLS